jgi:RNA polymerase sigma-70 factor (ECF subfamily)
MAMARRGAAERPEAGGGMRADETVRDAGLVELCQIQLPYSTEAFEVLVRRHEPQVFRTCWRYLGDAQEAEEASQDAFVRVFRGLARFEWRSSFRTWLFRIVHNVCVTRRRRRATHVAREAAYLEHTRGEIELEGSFESGTAHAGEDFAPGAVREAVERLSEADRQVLVLRFVSDLQLEEIAEVLELALSATKMRLYRAMERFQRAYRRDAE